MGGLDIERTVFLIIGSRTGAQSDGIGGSVQLHERQQSGKPIARFQLIQAKIADMYTQLEAARLMVYRAADELTRMTRGEKGIEIHKRSAVALLFSAEAAEKIAYDAVQIHGGNGYSDEYEVVYRDVRLGTIGAGTSEIRKTHHCPRNTGARVKSLRLTHSGKACAKTHATVLLLFRTQLAILSKPVHIDDTNFWRSPKGRLKIRGSHTMPESTGKAALKWHLMCCPTHRASPGWHQWWRHRCGSCTCGCSLGCSYSLGFLDPWPTLYQPSSRRHGADLKPPHRTLGHTCLYTRLTAFGVRVGGNGRAHQNRGNTHGASLGVAAHVFIPCFGIAESP